MKALVLSMGEKTTDFCVSQLTRYGFDVELIYGKESIRTKYLRFIAKAKDIEGGVLKVDADVIVNQEICHVPIKIPFQETRLQQYLVYNYFTNTLTYNGILYYPQEVSKKISTMTDSVNKFRPEPSALRASGASSEKFDSSLVVGLHGFFQSKNDVRRVRDYREQRGHDSDDQFINATQKI